MQIVQLGTDNLAYAIGLAKEMHELSKEGCGWPDFNWEFCRHMFIRRMNEPNSYFRLAQSTEGYVGAVYGHVEPFHFSSKLLGIEDAWYVREGTIARASIGKALMQSFIDWCETKNVAFVQSGDVACIRSVGVDTLYRHMGFTRFGVIYKYERKV